MYYWKMRVLGRGQVERTYAGVWKGSRGAVGRHRCRWMAGVLGFLFAVVGWLQVERLWQSGLHGGAIVGNGIVGVGDIAAVAAGVAVLWRVGLMYVPF